MIDRIDCWCVWNVHRNNGESTIIIIMNKMLATQKNSRQAYTGSITPTKRFFFNDSVPVTLAAAAISINSRAASGLVTFGGGGVTGFDSNTVVGTAGGVADELFVSPAGGVAPAECGDDEAVLLFLALESVWDFAGDGVATTLASLHTLRISVSFTLSPSTAAVSCSNRTVLFAQSTFCKTM
jgi:hypothetical protein